jgi:hypothetical protein
MQTSPTRRHSAHFWRRTPRREGIRVPWLGLVVAVFVLAMIAYFIVGLPLAR